MTHYAHAADLIEALPELVRVRRTNLGLSIRQLGAFLGVPFSSISEWETRKSGMSTDTAVMLLRWLAATAEEVSRG